MKIVNRLIMGEESHMNLNKLDRIVMDNEQVQMLDNWWLNIHEGDINYIPPVLEEGLIILKATSEELKDPTLRSKDIRIYFKQLSDTEVYYKIYRTNLHNQLEKILSATKNYFTLKSDIDLVLPNQLGLNPDNVIRFLDSITSSHIALMNYMALYKDVRERVASQTVQSNINKKKHKNKKKNVRSITTVVYKVSFSKENVTEQEKKEYNRIKESWSVRGHWRELKTGKKVWVKAHVKGDKNNIEPTTYIFSKSEKNKK